MLEPFSQRFVDNVFHALPACLAQALDYHGHVFFECQGCSHASKHTYVDVVMSTVVRSNIAGFVMPSARNLLSFTKMDDTSIPHIVIPAEAGIHGLSKVKMDPRFRGDDVSFAENCHSFR